MQTMSGDHAENLAARVIDSVTGRRDNFSQYDACSYGRKEI